MTEVLFVVFQVKFDIPKLFIHNFRFLLSYFQFVLPSAIVFLHKLESFFIIKPMAAFSKLLEDFSTLFISVKAIALSSSLLQF